MPCVQLEISMSCILIFSSFRDFAFLEMLNNKFFASKLSCFLSLVLADGVKLKEQKIPYIYLWDHQSINLQSTNIVCQNILIQFHFHKSLGLQPKIPSVIVWFHILSHKLSHDILWINIHETLESLHLLPQKWKIEIFDSMFWASELLFTA